MQGIVIRLTVLNDFHGVAVLDPKTQATHCHNSNVMIINIVFVNPYTSLPNTFCFRNFDDEDYRVGE